MVRKTIVALAGLLYLACAGAMAGEVVLSDEASQALAKAEADVKEARAQKALWTTAADALKNAREAAEEGDSAAVIKFSATASEHARLGIGQTKYPLTSGQ
ncbi:MAG: hypothetical protein AB1710_09510 [Pseudomonadota bacterium]|jgi:predicted benzoate:H+ symporter BenE